MSVSRDRDGESGRCFRSRRTYSDFVLPGGRQKVTQPRSFVYLFRRGWARLFRLFFLFGLGGNLDLSRLVTQITQSFSNPLWFLRSDIFPGPWLTRLDLRFRLPPLCSVLLICNLLVNPPPLFFLTLFVTLDRHISRPTRYMLLLCSRLRRRPSWPCLSCSACLLCPRGLNLYVHTVR